MRKKKNISFTFENVLAAQYVGMVSSKRAAQRDSATPGLRQTKVRKTYVTWEHASVPFYQICSSHLVLSAKIIFKWFLKFVVYVGSKRKSWNRLITDMMTILNSEGLPQIWAQLTVHNT